MKTLENRYEIIEGEGKPVIFLHGWLGNPDFWKLIIPKLEVDNPLVLFQQRIHRNSENTGFGMEQLSKDLGLLIEELDIREPLIVGHSMGGMTALKYTAENHDVSGLCLLATSASTPEPEEKSVDYFLDRFTEMEREKWAEEITENYAGEVENERIKQMTVKELVGANSEPIVAGLKAMKDFDIRKDLDSIEVPATVVRGEKDGAITAEKSRELAELLGTEPVSLNTGHQMLPEKPEKVAKIVNDFIEEKS